MALHDYGCLHDGTTLRDQYRSVTEGACAHPPLCPLCGNQMAWLPFARFDLRTDGTTFAKFQTYDGQNHPVEVDSLHALRKIERESEQHARNGEGQSMTFRMYANDRTNRDVNTHGDGPAQAPSAAGKQKFGLRGGTKAVDGEPDRAFGPGVSEVNTSALPMSGTKD